MEWKRKGDILFRGDPFDREAVAKIKARAQKLADKRGRPVQIDTMEHYAGSRKGYRAPMTMAVPRSLNPALSVGRSKSCYIRKLPGGKYQVKIAGAVRNPPAKKVKHHCQCGDSGCPVHRGTSHCPNAARKKVHRSDMEDRGGTWMCPGCAEDALSSGVFY